MQSCNLLKFSLEKALDELSLDRILVAFSGGVDSWCLLHACLSLKRKGLCIGVAHMDHGWREESGQEAEILKNKVESLGLPFYLKELDSKKVSGNLEDFCRKERQQFFQEVSHKEGYQAVFLAHHRDDLAETVLKRILEGASLGKITGIEPVKKINNLLTVRPFLKISKSQLIEYLKVADISYFEDRTNRDERFLRARMRTRLFPDLERHFGKSIREPLIRLSESSAEMESFMHKRFESVLHSALHLDCRQIESAFEVKWLLREWLKLQGISISFAALNDAANIILQKKGKRKVSVGSHLLEIDRGQLIVMA